MYITLETDYAVRIVAYLSSIKDGRSDSRTISEKTGVPPRFTVKLQSCKMGLPPSCLEIWETCKTSSVMAYPLHSKPAIPFPVE